MKDALLALAQSLNLGYSYKAVSVALEGAAMEVDSTCGPDPAPSTGDSGGYRPHYQGHGTTTRGGRGGVVIHVTNGAELAAAVARNEPRVVVFDASGNYDCGGQLSILHPFLTIAGQTAPNDGVTLVNTRLCVDTHDVVVQHLKVRLAPPSLNGCSVGDAGDGGDNSHVYNVVLDHVTVTWSKDVNNLLVAGPGSHDIAILDCLVGEGLWSGALGGIGAGIGHKNTVARCVFTQHWSRQFIWGAPGELAGYNNISFNGTDNSGGGDTLPAFYGDCDGEGNAPGPEEIVLMNNILIPGPNSGGVHAILGLSKKQGSIDAGSKIYLEGNQGPGITAADHASQWVATVSVGSYGSYPNGAFSGPQSNMRTDTLFGWWNTFKFTVMPANDVFVKVLQSVGARPKNRDAADIRMITDIQHGTGTHFLDSANVNLPATQAMTQVCQPPADPNGEGTRTLADGTKNTKLEDWLESQARVVEGVEEATAPVPPPVGELEEGYEQEGEPGSKPPVG